MDRLNQRDNINRFNEAEEIYLYVIGITSTDKESSNIQRQKWKMIEEGLILSIKMLLEILKNKPDKILEIKCYDKIAEIYSWDSKNVKWVKQRLKYLIKLKKILPEIPKDKLPIELTNWECNISLDIGDCYFQLKQYDKAKKYYENEIVKKYDKISYDERMTNLLNIKVVEE